MDKLMNKPANCDDIDIIINPFQEATNYDYYF